MPSAIKTIPLTESPVHSGTYVATIPPLWPWHGSVEGWSEIVCMPETAVLPNGGTSAGGEEVSLYGERFTGATGVTFGGVRAESFKVLSDEEIVAITPPGSGLVDVVVKTPGGETPTNAIAKYRYMDVTGIDKTTAGPEEEVTISGDGFTGAEFVYFGEYPTTAIEVVDDHTILATVPPGTGSDLAVRVGGNLRTTATNPGVTFTFGAPGGARVGGAGAAGRSTVPAPSATPARGAARRADGGFAAGWNKVCETLKKANPDVPCFPLPTLPDPKGLPQAFDNSVGAVAAATVLNAAASCADYVGRGGSPADCPPFVFRLDPSGTVLDNGNPVSGATTTLLRSEDEAGPFSVVGASSPLIEPNINPETTGSEGTFAWNVAGGYYQVVAEKSGCATASTPVLPVPPPQLNLKIQMFCSPEPPPPTPVVVEVAPDIGPTSGGATVTITGTGLEGARAVTFGGVKATSFTALSPTAVNATAPAGTGVADVRVETARGTSAATSADQFAFIGAPTLSSLSPEQGGASGGNTVTVAGSGLSSATRVTVGGQDVAFEAVSGSSLKFVAPSAGGALPVVVTAPPCTSPLLAGVASCGSSNALTYTFTGGPTVTKLAPKKATVVGGVLVTITGTKLTGATAVRFGAIEATSFTVKSATSISATAPAGDAGTADVTVTTAEGTSALTSADHFKYLPTVTGVSPAHGTKAGGAPVTITGSGFAGGTTATSFKFGTAKATSVNCISSTMCTAVAPAHAVGKVDVEATVNKATSAKDAPADQFLYE